MNLVLLSPISVLHFEFGNKSRMFAKTDFQLQIHVSWFCRFRRLCLKAHYNYGSSRESEKKTYTKELQNEII